MFHFQTYPKPSPAPAELRRADLDPMDPAPGGTVIQQSIRATRIEQALVNFTNALAGRNYKGEAGG